MAADQIEAALAHLRADISNCELALLKLIKVKKKMSDNTKTLQEINTQLSKTNIAIIGMAGIFPQSKNLREYWEKIIHKVDCITDVPTSRWSITDYYDPDPKAPDKTYCKRGGFIPDIDFNPMEFGLPPNILEVTDISQLLGLVVAKTAMEDAGYGENRQFNREHTGVVLGVAIGRQLAVPLGVRLQYPVWEKVLKSSGLSDADTQKIIEKVKSGYVQWEENAFPGMLANVIAGRIANRLDLGGMNCVVDAACASSLGALKVAISELIEHRADMMLTGGVDTDNSIFAYMCFSKTPAVSPGEKVKPFDVESDGMMLGEGVGMLVLKRLDDAVRDGDRIYAIIKGIGSSSDGKFKSIYAPSSTGQVKALRRAYADAGFSPATVGLIEAHGTGTMVGDPTEFNSIREVFSEDNPKTQYIALGSVKSQIGHTKAAAGAASLIKAALALHHKVLPPTINVTQPHPKLNIDNSPFYLNTQTRPWISPPHQPRRAGVSSFGFGGTNYHVVLEEYASEQHQPYRLHHSPQSILLSASTVQELLSRCTELHRQLQTEEGDKYFQELIKQTGEVPVNYARLGFVAESITQAREFLQICIDKLQSQPDLLHWEHPQGIFYRQQGIETSGKVVALFSGQGSQYLEMGRELVINFPCLRQLYADMDTLLSQDGLKPISEVVFPPTVFDVALKADQLERLKLTEYAQPAIGVFIAGLYKILQEAGFIANFVAGHSFGELTALWAAGVLTEEDYLYLVKARGQAMATPANTSEFGGMLAVRGNIGQVEELLKNYPEVRIANYNSPTQVVLAGKKTDINQVQDVFKAKGFSTFLLGVSAAFHTPLVKYAQKPFAAAVEKVNFHKQKVPVYTNVTGDRYPDNIAEMRKLLQLHLLNQVQFQREIENIYNAGGYCFVEFGPKAVLTNLVKEILGDKPHIAIALNGSQGKNSDRLLREAVVQLQVVGLPLQNLDPYELLPQPAAVPKHKQLNVRINSTNLDGKTQQNFAKALENGHKIGLPTVTMSIEKVGKAEKVEMDRQDLSTTTHKREEIVNGHQPTVNHHNGNSRTVNNSKFEKIADKIEIVPANYQRIIDNLENSIAELNRQQHDILQVHEQSLQNQTEYTKTFYQLMQQQHSLLGNSATTEYQAQTQQIAITSSERNMMRFHDHQGDSIRIHEKYLNYQQEYTNNYFQLLQQHYHLLLAEKSVNTAPEYRDISYEISTKSNSEIEIISPELVEKNFEEDSHTSTITVIPKNPINIDIATLSQTLLSVVSDKTGYPVEMLDLSMDMEADLGIDSIKRVEILGGLLELYPDLPQANPEELGQLRTLGQIAEYIQSLLPNLTTNQKAEIITELKQPVVEVAENPPLETAVPDIQKIPNDLSQIFLNIVSDKTGYPVEMLDLSMDIEADLGIDSIKRVEILGGLLELYPDLPKPNPEELGQLRTIAEIINYMQREEVNITQVLTESKPELNSEIFCSPVKLKQLPEPDYLEFTLAENSVAVITDDNSPITEKLAKSLTQKGCKTVVLSFPSLQSTLADHINRVVLTDWNEETLQQQLKNITQDYGYITTFIHLHPQIEHHNSEKNLYSEREKNLLRHVFLIAKYLKTSLNEAATKTRACFLAVTHLDGELGLGNSQNFGVIGAGLFGLTKTLNQEWENVFCRSLDLSSELDHQTAVNHILAEIHDPNLLITEVGYSSKGRVTLIADSTALPTSNLISTITPNQVFLVSGGAKGITAKCVIKLAQEYKCKFILLGRSSTEPEPVWTENCQDEAQLKQRIMEDFLTRGEKPTPIMVQKKYQAIFSQREIHNTLKAIEQVGGQAEYISVDVSDGVLLAEKLAPVVEKFGEITGIIHGAGNLADKRIEKKTIQDFETVYTPKVKGLENLLNAVDSRQLKYLILFSSVVGFYGNIGQSDYAIANEILNKTAHLFKHHHPHCHVVSINWGPWDSGMVSPELKKAFADRKIATIPVETGAQMLVNQLKLANQDIVQLVIGSDLANISYSLSSELKTYRIHRKLTLKSNPFLDDHVIANRPVLPATCGLNWMVNLSEQIYPGYRIFKTDSFKVLKGIIFDENLANEYLLELQEISKIANQEIEISAKISSQNPDGKIRYHFTTNLLLKRENPHPPKYENLNLSQNPELVISSQALYQNGASSLFHGTTFQGVTSILNTSPQHLTIECQLPEPTDKQQGQYPVQTFNPYITDVQIHSLWIWSQKYLQNGCLPSEIKTFEQFKPVPFGEKFYVTCEIKSHTETNVVAEIITYNHQGEIYNRMINAKGTLLPK